MTKGYDELISAAQEFMGAAAAFKEKTKLNPAKANELLAAGIVNRWFAKQGLDWRIEVSSKMRGPDGTLTGSGVDTQVVEFKSSKHTSPEFQFKADFNFRKHGCIVMTEFDNERPKHMFVAYGARTMAELAKRLDEDSRRTSYRPANGDQLRLFATSRGRDAVRQCGVRGIAQEKVYYDTSDRVAEIEGVEIGSLLGQSMSSVR